MELHVIDLGTETPGQRAAARRTSVVRPGMPGFFEEELRGLVAHLEANAGLQQRLGKDLQAAVAWEPVEGSVIFVVRAKPPAPPPGRSARKRRAPAAVD